jgi:hypothetical protein
MKAATEKERIVLRPEAIGRTFPKSMNFMILIRAIFLSFCRTLLPASIVDAERLPSLFRSNCAVYVIGARHPYKGQRNGASLF